MSVTITETEFSVGLARVKAKTLSGSGRVSRVTARVTGLARVMKKTLSGSTRVSQVRSGYGSGNRVSTG
jgi:hypothetical protein